MVISVRLDSSIKHWEANPILIYNKHRSFTFRAFSCITCFRNCSRFKSLFLSFCSTNCYYSTNTYNNKNSRNNEIDCDDNKYCCRNKDNCRVKTCNKK
ncbi:unnamed protein product [Moneuplotes crassus]|uniref:Uncharacterized protein n=1 Tax=Euplotes crassus TaxID=5936 RepID=A0AAD1XXH2_EUPCR|nr:unnamed protein product [Moneuplotes crassus]